MIKNQENLIPEAWRTSLSKAKTLSEVANLFNEAEQYDDFDCCAELKVWRKKHPANMTSMDKPVSVFAETDTEKLVYDEAKGTWLVNKR